MDNYSTIEGMVRQSTNNPITPGLYIKFKATHPDAVLPVANNKDPKTGDSGYDLVAVEDTFIPRGSSEVVPVGLTLADISPGYWVRIEPRSGLGFKHSIQPHLGVIDNGYRGDLGVKLYNFSSGPPSDDHQVKKGDKIAQLVMYELLQPKCEWATEITESTRGDKGFGSSDKRQYMTTQVADDWFYANTYQVDEGSVEMAKFDTVEEFMQYAKETEMPDDLFGDFLAAGVWKKK
jgi:dUTP pyrophosphatase